MPVFCFSDIEGSTQLWERFPKEMGGVIARHYAILESEVPAHGGEIIKYTGDGMFALFQQGDPLGCCIAIQLQMQALDWGPVGELRVRMALHAGEAEKLTHGDYYGTVANRTARLMSAAWGGQVLVSSEVLALGPAPEPAHFEDLGFHLLKDLGEPIQISGLLHPAFKLQRFPALKSLNSRPNNLPLQATPFFGRQKELAQIQEQLADPDCRLLTLLGPGGMGKTRLGLQAAAEGLEKFPHGAAWVPLAHLQSTEQLFGALAEALKFNFYGGQEQNAQVTEESGRLRPRAQASQQAQLLDYLKEKRLLLVLDNLEHLPGATDLLAAILLGAPQVKILASSRVRLDLQEERVLELQGLPEADAAGFFLQCARRFKADLVPAAEDAAALAKLCKLLEGLPLGLELAATWSKTLSCAEIAAELEKDLGFLETRAKNVPERHRSLRAAFDYSWKLLDPAEQAVLSALAVFRGGFSHSAAKAVAGASLPQLALLADQSLLHPSGQGRHEIHGFLGGYAAEKLDQDPRRAAEIRERHARHYASIVQSGQAAIDAEIHNVRQHWAWAVAESQWDIVESSLDGLYAYYGTRWLSAEGEQALAGAAEKLAKGGLLGKLQARRGVLSWYLGSKAKAREQLSQALALARELDPPQETAFALLHLGCISDGPDQKKLMRQSLELYELAHDKPGIAAALRALGYYAGNEEGGLFVARDLFQQSLELYRELGQPRGQAISGLNLGITAFLLGQTAESQQLCQECLATFTQIGDRRGAATATYWLSYCAEAAGDIPSATPLFEQALAEFRELGQQAEVAWCLEHLGILARSRGDRSKARDRFQESHELRKSLGDAVGMLRSFAQMAELAKLQGGVVPTLNAPGRKGKEAFWPF